VGVRFLLSLLPRPAEPPEAGSLKKIAVHILTSDGVLGVRSLASPEFVADWRAYGGKWLRKPLGRRRERPDPNFPQEDPNLAQERPDPNLAQSSRDWDDP